MRRVGPVLLLLALLAGCGGGAGAPARTHTVVMEGVRFTPDTLSVAAGDTVVWVNRDVVPHTATARDSSWNSGDIPIGGSWRRVMTEKGEHPYLCTYHPTMQGTVTVR